LVVSTKGILVLCSTKHKTTWANNNKFFHNNYYAKYIMLMSDLWMYTYSRTRHMG